MKKVIIVFILFNCLFHLFNTPFYLFNKFIYIPSLVERGYLNNGHIAYSDDLSVVLFFPAVISFLLTLALNKKSKSLILYVCLHNIYVLYSWFSEDPFDGEFIYTYVTSVSRLCQTIHLLWFPNDCIVWYYINKLNWTFVYTAYVVLVYNIVVYLIKKVRITKSV